MPSLGSYIYYIIFILNILFTCSLCGFLRRYDNCFRVGNDTSIGISRITDEEAKEIKYGLHNSTGKIPEAPKTLFYSENVSHPTFSWLTDPNITPGLEHLRYILLETNQHYREGDNSFLADTEHVLINVTGRTSVMGPFSVYSYNCTAVRPAAYRMEVTMWFIGQLRATNDGRLLGYVNNQSKSDTLILNEVQINQALQEEKREVEQCICLSNVTIQARLVEGKLSTKITGLHIPDATKVEIQLVREDTTGHYLERKVNVSGDTLQNPYYIKKFKVIKGKTYYIRVLRHCKTGYYVSCGQDKADVMRSQSVKVDQGHPSVQEPSWRPLKPPADTYTYVAQVAFITFAFGTCILAEVAVIMKLCTALFCRESRTKRFTKRSLLVKLDSEGKPVTRLCTSRKRVAIIYLKDSSEYEEAVYNIDKELRSRGVDTVLYDETHSQELRSNWIQAAEGVTKFECILFVISPRLHRVCQRDNPQKRNHHEEVNFIDTNTLDKFPGVVIDVLKSSAAWADAKDRKIISVCIAETKHECKQISINMRHEHPMIFKDKIHFHSFQNVAKVQGKETFQKLINKIIAAI